MDATTESIAHFIGLFEIATEENRLRDKYSEFERPKVQPDEIPELQPVAIRFQAPYEIEPYVPELAYQPAPVFSDGHMGGVYAGAHLSYPVFPDSPGLPLDLDHEPLPSMPAAHPAGAKVLIPPPSSVVAVTWQSAELTDDDTFLDAIPEGFVGTADLHAAFRALADAADSLTAFEAPQPGDDWADFAEEAISVVDTQVESLDADGLKITVLHGSDAAGSFVDGEAVDELPDWLDHLPEYLQPEEDPVEDGGDPESLAEEEDEEEESTETDPAGQEEASSGEQEQAAPVAREELETTRQPDGEGAGANAGDAGLSQATQEEDGVTTTPDSPTQGLPSVESRSDVEQAAKDGVLDHDFSGEFEEWQEDDGSGAALSGHKIVSGGNLAVNEVSIKSSWLDAPVIAVRGDVTTVEAVSQVNVLVEEDETDTVDQSPLSKVMNVAEIAVTSSASDEDEPSDPAGLPQNWGVVRVSGDVIQVNWVNQTTFATDLDQAVVESFGTATYLGLGENEIVNTGLFNEIGFFYDLIFVSGNMVEVSIASQLNVLFDSDSIVGAAGTQGAISAAENLLYNEVVFQKTGIDEITELTGAFARAAEDLAAGAQDISREVAQDALFTGKDLLRVLHIDGDFITANVLQQTTKFADADQLRVELGALANATAAEVIAGSNALVNLASVETFGLDSKIMAGGQVYDDALLYQAELIDRDALPIDPKLMAPLVNEAVAFLSDGMIEQGEAIAPRATDHAQFSDDLDVMQTVLA